MAKRDFAFGKENFILIAVAVACIVLGFILMSEVPGIIRSIPIYSAPAVSW